MEKRVDKRCNIPLRAVLSFVDAPTIDLQTSNISAGGASFVTDQTCLEGNEVFLTLFKKATLGKSDNQGTEAFMSLFNEAISFEDMLAVKFKARIVRCYNQGMAVCFDRTAVRTA